MCLQIAFMGFGGMLERSQTFAQHVPQPRAVPGIERQGLSRQLQSSGEVLQLRCDELSRLADKLPVTRILVDRGSITRQRLAPTAGGSFLARLLKRGLNMFT